jgi:hypothetical protein
VGESLPKCVRELNVVLTALIPLARDAPRAKAGEPLVGDAKEETGTDADVEKVDELSESESSSDDDEVLDFDVGEATLVDCLAGTGLRPQLAAPLGIGPQLDGRAVAFHWGGSGWELGTLSRVVNGGGVRWNCRITYFLHRVDRVRDHLLRRDNYSSLFEAPPGSWTLLEASAPTAELSLPASQKQTVVGPGTAAEPQPGALCLLLGSAYDSGNEV